jgi:ketosteroid isomerase-like protein
MVDGKQRLVEAAVIRENAAFYRAFTEGSFEAMANLWAVFAPVTCVHPGAPAILGRDSVLESWRMILREPPPQEMRCDGAVASVFGEVAVVTCYEGNGDSPAHLAATNVFVLEGGRWRLVHHHAGPLARSIPRRAAPSSLN